WGRVAMERIDKTNLFALVPQQPETSVTLRPSLMSQEKSDLILRWLQLASRQYKEELTEEDIAYWLRTLSSFPLKAIETSFDDYIAHETDEYGRAWMPKPAQISKRCRDWC